MILRVIFTGPNGTETFEYPDLPHLPRVGDTLTHTKYLRDHRPHTVTQVLWQLGREGAQKVIVTAVEDPTAATIKKLNAGG